MLTEIKRVTVNEMNHLKYLDQNEKPEKKVIMREVNVVNREKIKVTIKVQHFRNIFQLVNLTKRISFVGLLD